MLHKTESLIVADSILRLLRLDKRLKYVEGVVRPYINSIEEGYTIELKKINSKGVVSFATNNNELISVYIDKDVIKFLSEEFIYLKIFSNEELLQVRDYISNVIVNIIKNYNVNNDV